MRTYLSGLIAIFLLFTATAYQTNAQTPYRATDRQVQSLLTRIQTRETNFKQSVSLAIDNSSLNGTATEDTFFENISDFEQANDLLKQNVRSRNSTVNDVNDLLDKASIVNQFMTQNRLSVSAQTQWRNLKTDLNTLAKYYSVRWNPNVTNSNNTNNNYPSNNPYNTSTGNLTSLVSRLQSRTDTYKRELSYVVDRSMINNTRSADSINANVNDFVSATVQLKQNVDAGRSTTNDVQNVLNRAYFIDSFMRDYRLGAGAETQWNLIRTDLNTLANYYNVSWKWDNNNNNNNGTFDSGITGTYRLNPNQSDDVTAIVDRAAGSYTTNQRDNFRRNLERRLTPPDVLAIQKRGASVTIASSLSPQITFQTDGTSRTETTQNGRTIKTTANSTYNGIDLSYEGDRVNDFYINFVPVNNNQLRVVRRVYLENRNETVTVSSVYDKTDNTAQFSTVTNNNNNGGYNNGNGVGDSNSLNTFVVPNNTAITATLQTAIDTKVSQVGDRFQLRVDSPSQYSGAIIEGRITSADNSGRVSGRASTSFEFDTIRLTNGQTYRFAGIINTVKALNGDSVSVNNEGTVRDSNQTTKTVTRAGIGAALGAIIGAIAGGGQGAAIGAGIGAGAGAGTVILQGKDSIKLEQGSTFGLTASAPASIN